MTVTTAARTITIAEALNEAIRLEMRADPKIVIMGEDIAGGAKMDHLEDDEAWGGVMGVTKGLVHEFGRERVLDRTPAHCRIDVLWFFGKLSRFSVKPGIQASVHVWRESQCSSYHPDDDGCWVSSGCSTCSDTVPFVC